MFFLSQSPYLTRLCCLLSIAVVFILITPEQSWAWRYGKSTGSPVLSLATASTDGNDHAFIGVTTNTGSGTLFYSGSTSCGLSPTATQVKNGTVAGTVVSGSQGVSVSGIQSANPGSLSPVTAYCFYFVQNSTTDSNIISSASFTTNGTVSFSTTTTAAWDANVNKTAFNAIVAAIHTEFTNCFAPPTNITISQKYDYSNISPNVGQTIVNRSDNFYATNGGPIRNALIALPGKNSIQTAIYANPPANDPTGLGDIYGITNAQSLAIGQPRFSGQPDWTTTIDSTTTWDTTTNCSGGGACLRGVVTHEDSEGMGRKSGIDSFGGIAGLMEFSSYSAAATRNVTNTGTRYPSINAGTTNMISPFTYNQAGGSDLGDWTASGNDDFTANISVGSATMSTLDIKEMSKEGWVLTHSCAQIAP